MPALKIAAFAALWIACAAPAAAQTAVPHVLVVGNSFPGPDQIRGVAPVGDAESWIKEADFPASVRSDARGREAGPYHQVIIAQIGLQLTVEADNSISDCRGIYGTVDLAPHLCTLIGTRGKFRHALTPDGSPVSGTITMTVQYSVSGPGGGTGLPPSPGPDPRAWPVRWTNSEMRIASQPAWSGRGTRGDAEVAVLLYFPADGAPRCSIFNRSGEASLDNRSCAVALAATYAAEKPGGYGPLPLIVRWQRGHPSLIQPIRKRMQDAVLEGPIRVRGLPNPGALSPDAKLYLDVSESGEVTRCRIAASAGTDRADAEMCQQASRARFHPGEDVFGRPIADIAETRVQFE